MMELYGEYFCGNRISEYGLEHGFLDYGTLSQAFSHVMANDIMGLTDGVIGYWEPISGDIDADVFQWFIVDDGGAELLTEIGEVVWRNDELDLNLWGVTHWGTAWSYVLTDVPCRCGDAVL